MQIIIINFSSSLLQKNVHSTRFVTYFCESVLPNLSLLTSPVAELDIQLEVCIVLGIMKNHGQK